MPRDESLRSAVFACERYVLGGIYRLLTRHHLFPASADDSILLSGLSNS